MGKKRILSVNTQLLKGDVENERGVCVCVYDSVCVCVYLCLYGSLCVYVCMCMHVCVCV